MSLYDTNGPASVRPASVRSHFQTSPPKPLGHTKKKLCGATLGRQNENLFTASASHDKDGCNAHIWLKAFKNLLLQNRQADFHETWYVASGTPVHHNCTNDNPGVTLIYFTARSNLVTEAFL